MKRAPYADFSVWGPHGQRALRRQKLTGKQFDSDGSLITVELYGPCNLTAWLASYAVLATSLIMHRAVKRAHLDAYRDFIIELHNTFGDRLWVLLYQADVRMRHEWMDSCRRTLIGQHAHMLGMGGYTAFDPAQPWNMVWAEAVKADKFWQREFLTQCIRINCNSTSLSMVVNGDAPISHSMHDNIAAGVPSAMSSMPVQRSISAPPAKKQKTSGSTTTSRTSEPTRNAQGVFTSNRKGLLLCAAFQTNSCSNLQCPLQHQCGKCLQTHAATSCAGAGVAVVGKGCGKGRKGKGKKGKHAS